MCIIWYQPTSNTQPGKSHLLLSLQTSSKSWDSVYPPPTFFENLVGGSPSPNKRGRGGRTLWSLAILSDTTVRRSAVDWEDLKPYWKSEKRPPFIIHKFFKDFTNYRKKTNRVVVFSYRPFPQHSKIQGPPMKPSNNLEIKTLSNTYWRVRLVCKKAQAHSFLKPPLEYNQDQIPLTNQGSLWPF